MALKLRLAWRGTIRGELHSLTRRCNALKKYDARLGAGEFLTPAQLLIVQSMLDNVLAPLLAAKRLR